MARITLRTRTPRVTINIRAWLYVLHGSFMKFFFRPFLLLVRRSTPVHAHSVKHQMLTQCGTLAGLHGTSWLYFMAVRVI